MRKDLLKYSIGAVIVLGAGLLLTQPWSPAKLMLVSKGNVPVYATQADAVKSPPPPAIARLPAGEGVPVIECVNATQYPIIKVRLRDGRNGFVNEGVYLLMRGGKQAFCS